MAIYDHFASRPRVAAGVALKLRANRRLYALGLRHAPAADSPLLEIGPGDGYIASFARGEGRDYVAVEGSEAVADRLRHQGVEVHTGYVPPLPNSLPGGFGACYLLHVLEHMSGPAAAGELLTQIRDRLTPGGALVLACPAFEHWGSRFYDCDYTHCYPTTRRRVRQLLADHGFEIVVDTLYCGATIGRFGLPLSWLARVCWPAWLDRLIGHRVPRDMANRAVLTFLPNLLLVARASSIRP